MFNLNYQCQLFVYICILLTEKAIEKTKKANEASQSHGSGGYNDRYNDQRDRGRYERRDGGSNDRGYDRYDRRDRGGYERRDRGSNDRDR